MMLKNEWLVDVQAQRGSSVSMIRVDYLREGFNMRLMLEASIMQQLAGPSDHAAAQAVCRLHRGAGQSGQQRQL